MKKKNKMALRVLSTATFLTMVASCAAPAFADAYGIALYGNYYLDQGSVSVSYEDGKYYVQQGDGEKKEDTDGWVTISNNKDGDTTTATKNTVSISVKGGTADVTLKDVNINNNNTTEKAGISVDTEGESTKANITLSNVTVDPGKDNRGNNNKGGAGLEVKGNGTTSIELDGKNVLTGGANHAGVEKSNSKTDSKGVGEGYLIIKDDYDDGVLKTDEEKKDEAVNLDYSGSLTATGSGSAGIGGSEYNSATSNIKITGGNIIANGGNSAAGIGGAYGSTYAPGSGDAENIEITGGNIIATGDRSGAGIGSSDDGSASIKISGGTIHATSDSGAGIGGGENAEDTHIEITGGDVTGGSNYDGAGIGNGSNSFGKLNLVISGEDTKVRGSSQGWGAGIGAGYAPLGSSAEDGPDYNIDIRGGTINAVGSVGIGLTADASNKSTFISISGGKINAMGNSAGIGNSGGSDYGPLDIAISGGDIYAMGGYGAAGIGTDYRSETKSATINITGGTIKAVGGEGAAAIGGGIHEEGYDSNVTVKINGSNQALKITAIVQGDGKGAIGNGTVDGDDPFSGVDFDDITAASLGEEHGALVQFMNNYDAETGTGTLYKAIHNKKYIEETYNNPNDDHEWGNPQIIKEAAPGVQGIIRYTCVVDGCGATHDVPYDYVAPEEPDDDTPTTPDVKPDTPAAPETPVNPPVQDATPDTADTAPADSAVLPGNAQNPDVLDARPEDAPVTPANAVNPPVQDAKALPQTGSNWLAVLGTALSGVAMMAVGFFLDRKRGENR